jgi:hypothetical protein
MGKSRGLVRWAAEHGKPLTILTSRHDLYEQFERWCAEEGLNSVRYPSFYRDCPTGSDDHKFGDNWQKRFRTEYYQGLSAVYLHEHDRQVFGERLPCMTNGGCEYLRRRRGLDPREHDVIIGHYRQAHIPDVVDGRYVALDEFPEDAFIEKISQSDAKRNVGNYLQHELGIGSLHEFIELESHWTEKQRTAVEEWRERDITSLTSSVDLDEYRGGSRTTPLLVRYFDEVRRGGHRLENGWRRVVLGPRHVVVEDANEVNVYVLTRPDLRRARSVVAVDGTPTIEKWRVILGEELHHLKVLSTDEKTGYLRDVLGLKIIQTALDTYPVNNRKEGPEKALMLFNLIRDEEGRPPAYITSNQVRKKMDNHDEYDSDGLAGLPTNHYGNFRGQNDMAEERLGLVIGSAMPPDEIIQKWAAFLGVSADRGTDNLNKGVDLTFGNPEADEILRDHRERTVLQAVMRFGRTDQPSPETGEWGATVYVHTAALPEWVEREIRPVEFVTWNDLNRGMGQVVGAVRSLIGEKPAGEWRQVEIEERLQSLYEEGTIGHDRIRKCLKELAGLGLLGIRQLPGRGRPLGYRNNGLERAGSIGIAKFQR